MNRMNTQEKNVQVDRRLSRRKAENYLMRHLDHIKQFLGITHLGMFNDDCLGYRNLLSKTISGIHGDQQLIRAKIIRSIASKYAQKRV